MKRIVICCDGTWNTPKQVDEGVPAPTNVFKITKLILPQVPGVPHLPTPASEAAEPTQVKAGITPPDQNQTATSPLAAEFSPTESAPIAQIVYYHPGVGTHGGWLPRLWDAISGFGISANIRDAYRFLIRNYESGDQLFLFGFSRGAFTVRSLAGLIRWCGILRPDAVSHVRKAFNFYRSRDDNKKPRTEAATEFRRKYAVEDISPIEFIGVWDTVGALGNPLLLKFGNEFHDVGLSTMVRYAYHAVSIDEKRKQFVPALWQQQSPPPAEMQAAVEQISGRPWSQTLEQRWFCGTHSNVGGGYRDAGLSDVALRWMIAKAQGAGLSIAAPVTAASALGTLRESWRGIWRFLGRKPRAIDEPAPDSVTREQLDDSVAVRWQNGDHATPLYRPANLEDFYRRHPDQRPVIS
ncbi:MAG TPA: DUF2235 domain-containing protein [Pirellulales bacterium]